MNEKLHTFSEGDGVNVYVSFSGAIDEDAMLPTLASLGDVVTEKSRTMLVELGRITALTPLGARLFMSWLEELQCGDRWELVLVDCSPAVLERINRIDNLVGGARIRSITVAYKCERCSAERAISVDARACKDRTLARVRCEECDGPMQPLLAPEQIFSFVDRGVALYVDASLDQVIAKLGARQRRRDKRSVAGVVVSHQQTYTQPGVASGENPYDGSTGERSPSANSAQSEKSSPNNASPRRYASKSMVLLLVSVILLVALLVWRLLGG